MDEMTTRCEAVLRKSAEAADSVYDFGRVCIPLDVAAACMARAIAHLLPSDAWPEEWDDALAAARGEEE